MFYLINKKKTKENEVPNGNTTAFGMLKNNVSNIIAIAAFVIVIGQGFYTIGQLDQRVYNLEIGNSNATMNRYTSKDAARDRAIFESKLIKMEGSLEHIKEDLSEIKTDYKYLLKKIKNGSN